MDFKSGVVENCDCCEYMDIMPDGKVDLIIGDPPYFRVMKKEKWDKFKSQDEYLQWSREYISRCVKKLRLSGTFLLYGCSVSVSTMCKLDSILVENGMYFVEEIIINKGMKSMAGRISSKAKMLPPVSENIFVYRKDAKPFVKELLLSKQHETGMSTGEIKKNLGIPLNGGGNWTKYCGNTEFPLLPTREHWMEICRLFDIGIPYDDIEETYNGICGLTNVWDDINFYVKGRQHPSEKPLELADRCIKIFSRENDLVYIPFAGSGNDIVACIHNKRKWAATEIDKEYYQLISAKLQKNSL